MKQVIVGGAYTALSATGTKYNALGSGYTWDSTAINKHQLVSTPGKLSNLLVELDDTPGAGKSYNFTLMVNDSPSALTLEIADAATTGADTTHEVDVVAGDTICLRCVPTNTPTVRAARWSSVFEGTNAKESLILGIGWVELEVTDYCPIMQAHVSGSIVETNTHQVIPTPGKIKNLYVELKDDPGTAPGAYRFTLRKNGVSQALTVTIVADNKTGNDTVNEVAVVAGDYVNMMMEPIDTPSVAPFYCFGFTFVADTDGESLLLGQSSDNPAVDQIEYCSLVSTLTQQTWATSEISRYQGGQPTTLKKLYVKLSAAPGAGKSYAFTVRVNGVDGNLTVPIADAATTGNDVAHTDVIANYNELNVKCEPTGTPDATLVYWGLVGFIQPPPPPLPSYPDKTGNIAAKMVAAGLI